MKIDLLYFDGCPSWENALANIHLSLKEESLDYSITLVKIETDQEASARKFLGSPSIQIDGDDLWPEDRTSYSMNCRVYRTPAGLKGWPTEEMLRIKLIENKIKRK